MTGRPLTARWMLTPREYTDIYRIIQRHIFLTLGTFLRPTENDACSPLGAHMYLVKASACMYQRFIWTEKYLVPLVAFELHILSAQKSQEDKHNVEKPQGLMIVLSPTLLLRVLLRMKDWVIMVYVSPYLPFWLWLLIQWSAPMLLLSVALLLMKEPWPITWYKLCFGQ